MEESVKEYMKTNVITVEKNKSLKEVAEVMAKNKVGSVIVVENGKPLGIITETDVVRAIGNGKGLTSKADEIMTAHLITIKADSPVTGALSLMRTYNIRHLPVVDDNGSLVGIISIRDIARALDDIYES